ncbi:MAG: glycoside hydrolase family 31 protein [Mongoliitalea sp.]
MKSASQRSISKQNLAVGNVNFWKKTDRGISGETEHAFFQLTVYADHTIRVQISRENSFSGNPYSVISQPENSDFTITENEGNITLQTSFIQCEVNLQPFHLTFLDKTGNILNQDDPAFAVSWLGTEVTNYKKVQADEKFIGLGEKTGGLNRAGSAYTNWNTDYFGYGVGDDPLYMSIPFYIGIHQEKAYGIFFDNTHKTIFNFGASNNRFIYYSADDGDMDYYFFHHETVADIIQAYCQLTGTMELPPLWSLGFQQCRYSYYPDSEVLTLAKTFRDKNMPADVIYLDIHHMDKYKVFTFDPEKFADPKQMIAQLKSWGFRVVVIMDPGIKTEEGYTPYTDGLAKDLFVKYPDGTIYEGQVWPGWCAFPDFTKGETRTWWAEQMEFYRNAGVDGYWTDMNEPASWGQFTPNLIEFSYEGEEVSHRKARNIYGFQMARSAKEGAEFQNPEERAFVLTRAGFSGIQRYAAAWTGDNVASDEHMLAGIRLVNSLGLSGVSFAGYDVGGFAGEASKALFARWMSVAAFAPFYRAHSMINSNDAEPWAFGEEVEEISRNYMKLRYRLLPTIYSSFKKSSDTGLPISRSLAIDYSFDTKIYESAFQNQYLFCDQLLIAPVESFKEITKVYLPKGEWYYLFDDQKHTGNQVIYQDCPLNYLPVYVKGSAILALQSDVSHTADATDGILQLHVYQGQESNTYIHYEDDGISKAYLDGTYHSRQITWNPQEGTLLIDTAEGTYPSKFEKIAIYIHGREITKAHIHEQRIELGKETVSFLGKLTEFDPLPEYLHPYYEIKDVPCIEVSNTRDAILIHLP